MKRRKFLKSNLLFVLVLICLDARCQIVNATLRNATIQNAGFVAGSGTLWNNLTFHLNMDEVGAVDRTDNKGSLVMTHTGVGVDGPLSTNGIIVNAADFRIGNSQYLFRSDHANVDFANESFTISVWVNLRSEVFTALVTLGNAGSSVDATKMSYMLLYRSSTHRFEFKVADGSSIGTISADTFGAPSLNTWYHVVARHRQGTNIGIKVNTTASQGSEDTAAWTTGVNHPASATFYVGVSDTVFFYDGFADEVSIFREALSSGNETTLWNSGAGLTYP